MRLRYAQVCRIMLIVAALVTAVAVAAIAFRYTFLVVLIAVAVWYRRLGRWRGSHSHGSAAFASTATTLEPAGMLDDRSDLSLPLGKVIDVTGPVPRPEGLRALFSLSTPSPIACRMALSSLFQTNSFEDRIIWVNDYCHVAVIARTGAGKGVGYMLPILHSYLGSVVVLDPKSENYLKSVEVRSQFSTVILLDPMKIAKAASHHSLNPMAFIDPDALDFADECRDLANAIVIRPPEEKEPHFNDRAEMLICAVIAFVVVCSIKPEDVHLGTVHKLLSSPESMDLAIERMRKCGHPVVESLGGQCAGSMGEEKASAYVTVQRQMSWLTSQAVRSTLATNSFDPRDFKRGSVPISLFMAIPPHRMSTWAPLLRVWIACLFKLITDEGPDETRQTLFLLDEVGQLSRFRALENAASIMRGYGIRLFLSCNRLNN